MSRSDYNEGYRAAIRDAVKVVNEEPELPGDPPFEVLVLTRSNPVESLRAAVITTKRGIRNRLKELKP